VDDRNRRDDGYPIRRESSGRSERSRRPHDPDVSKDPRTPPPRSRNGSRDLREDRRGRPERHADFSERGVPSRDRPSYQDQAGSRNVGSRRDRRHYPREDTSEDWNSEQEDYYRTRRPTPPPGADDWEPSSSRRKRRPTGASAGSERPPSDPRATPVEKSGRDEGAAPQFRRPHPDQFRGEEGDYSRHSQRDHHDRRSGAAKSRQMAYEEEFDAETPVRPRGDADGDAGRDRPAPRREERTRHAWNEDQRERFDQRESVWAPAWQQHGPPAPEWQLDRREERRRSPQKSRGQGWASQSGYFFATLGQRSISIGKRTSDLGQTSYRWAIDQKDRFLSTVFGRILLAAVAVVLLLGIIGSAGAAYSRYTHIKMELATAVADLQNVGASLRQLQRNPFEASAIREAREHLAVAHAAFVEMNDDVQGIPGILSLTPGVGSKLSAAFAIGPMAVKATQAAILGCDILALLAPTLQMPLATNVPGLSLSDVNTISTKFASIYSLVGSVLAEVQSLPPSAMSFNPVLGSLLVMARNNLPEFQQGLRDARNLVALLPQLLGVGNPAHYLLEVLDPSDLRPGGGLIESFGDLTVVGGRLQGEPQLRDVDLCGQQATGKGMPLPGSYSWFTTSGGTLNFQDANLDTDFAADAQMGQDLYNDAGCSALLSGGITSFQGVIALTPQVIDDVLQQITGPITLPDYKNLVISPTNLIQEIHSQQGTSGQSGTKVDPNPVCGKSSFGHCFTAYLFSVLLAQLAKTNSSGSSDPGRLGRILENAIVSKDIQIYFTDPKAEAALAHRDLASTINPPNSGDSLMVVDANEGNVKANNYLTYTWNEQVTIDTSGNATHHLTLTYLWPDTPETRANAYPASPNQYIYEDYLHIYVPSSSTTISPPANLRSVGTVPAITTGDGLKIIEGLIYEPIGATFTVDLTWTVPQAAIRTANGWLYQDNIDKQAGFDNRPLNIAVTLPSCANIFSASPGFTMPTAATANYKQPLSQDVSLSLQYTCY